MKGDLLMNYKFNCWKTNYNEPYIIQAPANNQPKPIIHIIIFDNKYSRFDRLFNFLLLLLSQPIMYILLNIIITSPINIIKIPNNKSPKLVTTMNNNLTNFINFLKREQNNLGRKIRANCNSFY